MSDTETITIDLPRSMAEEVRRTVENGQFATSSQAVQVALREWQARHRTEDYTVVELRRLVQEGVESGPSTLGSMADLKREARRRWGRGS